MAKKKRARLSPELRQKYRAWLQGQRTGTIEYGCDESAVRDAPLSTEEAEGVERWLRDIEHASDIEFEESDEEDEDVEDAIKAIPTAPGILAQYGLTMGWLIFLAILLALGVVTVVVRW